MLLFITILLLVLKRASHTAAIIESDSMMIFGGITSHTDQTEREKLNMAQQ